MGDHIVVLEGGQSEARGQAVINAARQAIPNKPIRYVVNTHPHFDHASGLAPFVAEGITIITHENNEDFLEDALGAPRRLVGDALAKANRKPNVEGVGDRRVLKGASHTIELHHVRDLQHTDGMLIAYLPNEKVLVQRRLRNSESRRAAGAGQSVADGARGEPRSAEAGLHQLHHGPRAGAGAAADEGGPDGCGRTRDELAERPTVKARACYASS